MRPVLLMKIPGSGKLSEIRALGARLTAGLHTLDVPVEVRILCPQPLFYLITLHKRFEPPQGGRYPLPQPQFFKINQPRRLEEDKDTKVKLKTFVSFEPFLLSG